MSQQLERHRARPPTAGSAGMAHGRNVAGDAASAAAPRRSALEFERLARDIMRVQLARREDGRQGAACRTASTAPSTPRRRSPSTTPSCASSTTCRPTCRPASPARARPTAPSCASPTPPAPRAPTPRPTCAASRCGCRCPTSEAHDLLMTNFPVSHARDARQFVEFARATAGGPRRRWCAASLRLVAAVRPARDGPHAPQRDERPAAHRHERRHRDLLEPRRDPLGRRPRRALPAAPGARHAARAEPADGRPELPVDARPRADSPRGDVRFELCVQRYVDEARDARSRTPRSSGRSASRRARARRGADDRAARPRLGRRAARGAAPIDAPGLQPVEHHRRVPPARQSQPGAQGGLRRRASAHRAGLPLADAARRSATTSSARAARAVFVAINRVVAVAPAAAAARACSTSTRFRHVLRTHNLIDTEPREAPPTARPVPPAAAGRGRRALARTLDGTRQRPLGAADGRRRRRPSAATCRRVYRPDLFDEPNPVDGQPASC